MTIGRVYPIKNTFAIQIKFLNNLAKCHSKNRISFFNFKPVPGSWLLHLQDGDVFYSCDNSRQFLQSWPIFKLPYIVMWHCQGWFKWVMNKFLLQQDATSLSPPTNSCQILIQHFMPASQVFVHWKTSGNGWTVPPEYENENGWRFNKY